MPGRPPFGSWLCGRPGMRRRGEPCTIGRRKVVTTIHIEREAAGARFVADEAPWRIDEDLAHRLRQAHWRLAGSARQAAPIAAQEGLESMTADATAVAEAGRDFIRDIIRSDLDRSAMPGWSPGFRPSPTAISTSATPSPFASISAWRRSSAAAATCVSTTPIRPRRSRNTSTPSSRTCAGSASTGASISITRRTISSSSTSGPST